MANFDYPKVSLSGKTNEENIQAVKAWAIDMADMMNAYINNLEERVTTLESMMNELKGDK